MATKKTPVAPANNSELAGTDTLDRGNTNTKLDSLEQFRSDATGQALRTNQGVKVADNQNTLKAGDRGPSLLEDFIMREKITHFETSANLQGCRAQHPDQPASIPLPRNPCPRRAAQE